MGNITDERIEQVACDEMQNHDWDDLNCQNSYKDGFVAGAKWIQGLEPSKCPYCTPDGYLIGEGNTGISCPACKGTHKVQYVPYEDYMTSEQERLEQAERIKGLKSNQEQARQFVQWIYDTHNSLSSQAKEAKRILELLNQKDDE